MCGGRDSGSWWHLVALVTLVGKACRQGFIPVCAQDGGRRDRHKPRISWICQQPPSLHCSALPRAVRIQSRKMSLPPLTAVKMEAKTGCSYRNPRCPGFILPFFFSCFSALVYYCSFLEGNLRERGNVAKLFCAGTQPSGEVLSLWHRGQALMRDKARRRAERKAAQMPGVPGLEKRNAVGKSSSVSTEVGLSSPGVSRPLCQHSHC